MVTSFSRSLSNSLSWFTLLAVGIVGLLGMTGCSDTAHADDVIRGSPYKLEGLTAALLGQPQGVRLRYAGPKKMMGFRLVTLSPEGDVVRSENLSMTVSDAFIHVDHIAVVALEDDQCPSGKKLRLTVRCAALDGSSTVVSSTHIDEYFPDEYGAIASSWPLGSEEVEDERGLPVFYVSAGGREPVLRVDFFVQ